MESIKNFKDMHKGKRLFIIASGPSIKDLDFSGLERRITMGLNRSFMKYPDTYYQCTFDHRLFEMYPDELKKSRYLFTLEDRPWGIPINLLGSEGFSWDLEEGIYSGYTIAYFGLQVAVYMGFSEIFFLGLDMQNPDGQTHFFGVDQRSADHENTEFPKMKNSFIKAANGLKEKGIKVYNCSKESTLKCFPYMSFEEAMAL